MSGKSGRSGTNKNKDKPWTDALRMCGSPDNFKKLRLLADKTYEMALAGDMAAIREIGDRLDGKPAQSVEHSGQLDLRRAAEMTDDELAAIAAGSSSGAPAKAVNPSKLN